MNQRNNVVLIEVVANLLEGIILLGYVVDVWFISLKVLLVASYLIEGPAMAIAWLKFVDTKGDGKP